MNNFWSHYIFDPLDQASLICFGDISLKLVNEKYLDNILSISVNAFVVYSFSRKMSQTFIKELSKLIKEKYLDYILSIFVCFCCFLFFQEITFLLSE